MENVQTNVLSKEQKRDFVESVAIVLRDVIPDSDVRNWIGCQFALESDFGRSNVVQKYCNFCGMKPAHKRPTSRIKHLKGDYAYYDSFESCVLDYILWFTYKGATQYYYINLYAWKAFIRSSGYCPAVDYVKRVDSIYNSLY